MPFTYDAPTGRYFYPNGEPVPASLLRGVLEDVIGDSHARLRVLSERWAAGALDTLGWRTAAQQELKTVHGLAAQLARGGQAGMTASARGHLGAALRTQYDYLSHFALDVIQGTVDKQSDAVLARAGMYANAARTTFASATRQEAQARGEDEERRVLGGGSASCDDCIGYADQGWQPAGELPLPGEDSQCLVNCNCSLESRAAEPAAVEG